MRGNFPFQTGLGLTCDQAFFPGGRKRKRKGGKKIRLIHLFCEQPTAPTINKLNCLSTVRSNGRSRNACDKRLAI